MLADILSVNNANLGPIEFDMVHVNEDRSVDKPEQRESELPGGGIARWTVAPVFEHGVHGVVAGESLCHEYYEHSDQRGEVIQTNWFDGSLWTESTPSRKLVSIRRTDQMAGRAPFDPRQQVAHRLRWRLAEILRDWPIVRCQPVDEQGQAALEFTAPNELRLRIEFDSEFDLLPVKSILFNTDGSISQIVEINYEMVAERSAWFVANSSLTFFSLGVCTDIDADSDTWTQRTTIQITNVAPLSPFEAETALTPTIPTGYAVQDLTITRAETTRDITARQNGGSASQLRILLFVNLAAVAVVSVWMLRRLRHHGTSKGG